MKRNRTNSCRNKPNKSNTVLIIIIDIGILYIIIIFMWKYRGTSYENRTYSGNS